jgi:hypothetical protein
MLGSKLFGKSDASPVMSAAKTLAAPVATFQPENISTFSYQQVIKHD